MDKNQESATILRQMYTWEKQRHASRSVKNALLQFSGGGVTKVEVDNDDGTTTEITTKNGIEEGCIKENNKNFFKQKTSPA